MNTIPSGPAVNRTARDERIYLLKNDRTKHHFLTAERIDLFGYPPQNAATLPASVVDAFATGARIGTVARIANSSTVWLAEGGAKRHVYDQTPSPDC